MVTSAEDLARIQRSAARVEAHVATPLAELAPHLKPYAAPLAGGQVVLLGPGMYVNRGLAMGLGIEITTEHLEALEARSAAAGVPPEVEVAPWADPSLLERTASRGYRPVGWRSTLLRPLPQAEQLPTPTKVTIEEVRDATGLSEWQDTAAEGFGFTTGDERRISDLYVAAVHASGTTHLYLARLCGRAVAVASLAMHEQVGILGGMTTVPSARGQGVQRALIGFRLAAAARAGCRVALSTTAPVGGSERNLLRSGFSIAGTTLTVRRPSLP